MKSKNRSFTILALPALLLLFVFHYLPMAGLVLAFKDFRYDKGILGSKWVGLKNFVFFFTSQDAFRVTRNTLVLNVIFIITTIIGAVIVAILLNEIRSRLVVKIYQTVLFFPYFLSWAVVAFMAYAFFNADLGILNRILKGIGMEPVLWYSQPQLWPGILTFVNFWKFIGHTALIFYAGLMAIDSSYYESAAIDGANRLQMATKITIPLLMPVIVIMVLIKLGRIFHSDFGLFYMVTRDTGVLYPTTDVIDTYVFRSLRVVGDIGMSAAVGFYQSVVAFILVIASNWVIKKFNKENAMF